MNACMCAPNPIPHFFTTCLLCSAALLCSTLACNGVDNEKGVPEINRVSEVIKPRMGHSKGRKKK